MIERLVHYLDWKVIGAWALAVWLMLTALMLLAQVGRWVA